MRIFEKHPHADAYRVRDSYEPYAVLAVDKRLTDAELAAELNTMKYDWLSLVHSGYYAGLEIERCETLYRFATHPHFDEEQ